jgi:hypothetical protein
MLYVAYPVQAFKGLDIVIAEAGKAGIKLIIALTNNWSYNTLQTDWKCAPSCRHWMLAKCSQHHI